MVVSRDDVLKLASTALAGAVPSVTELGRRGGKRSGEVRRKSRRWVPHAEEIALTIDPNLSNEDIANAITDRWKRADVNYPGDRTLVRFVAQLRAAGTLPPQSLDRRPQNPNRQHCDTKGLRVRHEGLQGQTLSGAAYVRREMTTPCDIPEIERQSGGDRRRHQAPPGGRLRVMLTRRQCQQCGNWGPTSQIAKENAGDLDSVLDGSVRKITAASFYRHLIELAIRSHPPAGPVKARQPAARYQRRCPRREPTQAELEALKRGNERRRRAFDPEPY